MPNAPKTPARAVRISEETWAALRDVAERKGLTISDVIRLALADFLARNH
jgi:antitoxin component of RelBE/YafQ-DinJ toxin-antitoxin module